MNTTARDHILTEFAGIRDSLPGRRLPWLAQAREQALASFAQTGFPTQRDEDWKYTSVAPIENKGYLVTSAASGRGTDIARQIATHCLPETVLLVFVNGRHQPKWSRLGPLPAGVTIGSLAGIIEHAPEQLEGSPAAGGSNGYASPGYASPFAALNTAFMADGAFIRLAPGAVLDEPIHLLFIASAHLLANRLMTHPRNVILAGEGSRASIVEHYVAVEATSHFTNALTDIVVGRGAQIEHHRLQQESLEAFHVARVNVDQQQGSRFTSNAFALGGALARVDIDVGLNAERAECALNGLYLTAGRQHADHHTRIDHSAPRCVSRELYKGVLDGASRAVFNGKVIVHADAQHSDAQQSNRNLLLSESAEVDTKPQLEIYADDVKCSHGATVGQLDAEQIFYLRSRGVDAVAARALLIAAFANEVVSRVSLAPLRTRLEKLLQVVLRGRLPETMQASP